MSLFRYCANVTRLFAQCVNVFIACANDKNGAFAISRTRKRFYGAMPFYRGLPLLIIDFPDSNYCANQFGTRANDSAPKIKISGCVHLPMRWAIDFTIVVFRFLILVYAHARPQNHYPRPLGCPRGRAYAYFPKKAEISANIP